LSVGIGLIGGVVGWVFLRASAVMLSLTLTHRWDQSFPTLAKVQPGWGLIAIAAAGGLVVALLARLEPMVRGHGIPETMDAVLREQSRISS
jgi:H+/Cl- antiporter ClcA